MTLHMAHGAGSVLLATALGLRLLAVTACELPADQDGDGYDTSVDCDDANPQVHPDAPEDFNDIDDNCNGIVDEADAVPCDSLEPTQSMSQNWRNIQGCLDERGRAKLGPGEFLVDQGIAIWDGAELLGDATWPVIRLVQDPVNWRSNFLVKTLGQGSRVGSLTLDGYGNLPAGAHGAVVHIEGNEANIEDNHILNSVRSTPTSWATGVYFICADCRGNVVQRNQIYQHFRGVIFRDALKPGSDNALLGNGIRDNMCDGITMAGFGIVAENEVFRNGYDCLNGGGGTPIPGAAIYSLDNKVGAVISNNTLYDSCGHNLDVDNASNFLIKENVIRNPGYQWDGIYSYCGTAASMFLMETTLSTIIGNVVENNGRLNNQFGYGPGSHDTNGVFSPTGEPDDMSDLPAGGNTVLAFVLAMRKNATNPVISNVIEGNQFRSACDYPCVGVGYFASRNTGFGLDLSWSAQTTNYYTSNNPYGSNIGSIRCGGNWYAANSVCEDSAPADSECNQDDYQHNPPSGDWARSNPDCKLYE